MRQDILRADGRGEIELGGLRLAFWALLTLGCVFPAGAQQSTVEDVGWMAGCWLAESDGLVTEEIWMEPGGGTMVGMVRTLRAGRASGYELLLLGQKDGVLTLSAYPSGQSPTDFRAVSVTGGEVRFRNPDHDFPKEISYHRGSPDSLVAKVFGEVDAATPSFQVLYGRTGCPGQ